MAVKQSCARRAVTGRPRHGPSLSAFPACDRARRKDRRLRDLTGAIALALALVFWAPAGAATRDPSELCEQAAMRAARATGVPLEVLRALALTESGRSRGRQMKPWPWTLNAEGRGAWFGTRGAAEAAARRIVASGVRSVDLGCFQVNYRWHGDAFASLEAMLEPDVNALYAARFLAGLAAELGSWEAAAGAYHSRTPELADRYVRRFRTHLAALARGPLPAPAEAAPAPAQGLPVAGPRAPRVIADFPLLQAGIAPGMGSLVPTGGARATLLSGPAEALR
jgi:hypothetical protein